MPRPSQVLGVFSSKPEQLDDSHTVFSLKSVHRPAPSQRPVRPQVVASSPLQSGSARLTAMYEQWPTEPVSPQDTHAPLQAMLQQTWSTQKPDRHPSLLSQSAPLMLLPHELETHSCPDEHWTLVAHLLAHLLVEGSQV